MSEPVRLIDDDIAHGGAFGQRVIDGGLELDLLAAAKAPVGGDDHGCAQILDAGLQRLGREAAEDDAMDDPQARAGEHGDGQLRNHGHVNDGSVAGADSRAI